MNQTNQNCCEKCLGSYGFGKDNWGCIEKGCSCHTPQTSEKGWEQSKADLIYWIDELVRWADAHSLEANSRKQSIGESIKVKLEIVLEDLLLAERSKLLHGIKEIIKDQSIKHPFWETLPEREIELYTMYNKALKDLLSKLEAIKKEI